jgi:hypothetical protein
VRRGLRKKKSNEKSQIEDSWFSSASDNGFSFLDFPLKKTGLCIEDWVVLCVCVCVCVCTRYAETTKLHFDCLMLVLDG